MVTVSVGNATVVVPTLPPTVSPTRRRRTAMRYEPNTMITYALLLHAQMITFNLLEEKKNELL
jgi:hypothetical protein